MSTAPQASIHHRVDGRYRSSGSRSQRHTRPSSGSSASPRNSKPVLVSTDVEAMRSGSVCARIRRTRAQARARLPAGFSEVSSVGPGRWDDCGRSSRVRTAISFRWASIQPSEKGDMVKALLTGFAIVFGTASISTTTPTASPHPFSLVLESTAYGWAASCDSGCRWRHLGLSCNGACGVITIDANVSRPIHRAIWSRPRSAFAWSDTGKESAQPLRPAPCGALCRGPVSSIHAEHGSMQAAYRQ